MARSGTAPQPIAFRAQPGQTVTVRGAQYGFYLSARNWITIDGFDVTDTTSDGIHVVERPRQAARQHGHVRRRAGLGLSPRASRLERDRLRGRRQHGHAQLQLRDLSATCHARRSAANDLAFNAKQFSRAASGIRLHSSPGNTISRNVSHDNEDSGIELVTGSDGNLVVDNVSTPTATTASTTSMPATRSSSPTASTTTSRPESTPRAAPRGPSWPTTSAWTTGSTARAQNIRVDAQSTRGPRSTTTWCTSARRGRSSCGGAPSTRR